MQELNKPNQTPDELSAEFDAIVGREETGDQKESTTEADNNVPVTVNNTASASQPVATPAESKPVAKEEPVIEKGPSIVETVAPHANTPGTLILQWLTYAFWGWYALAMIWLVGVVIAWIIDRSGVAGDIGGILPYPMAASVILLLIALGVDFFYARIEPVKKKGAASVIMIIHAVIFALCGIGALITAVFAVIYSLLNAGVFGGAEGSKVIMLTSFTMMIVYILLTLRTVAGAGRKVFRTVAWVVLSALLVAMAVIGVVGPVSDAIVTKQGRLIENALPSVASNINAYAGTYNRLPISLDEASSTDSYQSEEVKELIGQNLVRYTANTKPAEKPAEMNTINKSDQLNETNDSRFSTYFYKLCVTYKAEKKPKYNYESSVSSESSSYLSTSSHGAGEKCYDMKAESFTQ